MSRVCERDDLRVMVPAWSYWTVDDNGDGQELLQETPADPSDVEQYYCANCQLDFQVGDGVGSESIEAAWQAALDHLAASAEGVA